MGRHQPVIEEGTVERIREAALSCFSRHGYEGASMRQIALAAEVSVPGLYHYFPSKQDLLFELISATHDAAVAQVEAAVALAGDDPRQRLAAAVWADCDYHTRFRRESFVSNTELRSLDPERRARIVAKRDSLKLLMRDIIASGAEQGVFDVPDPVTVSRAILTMCTAISTWYDPGGPEMPRQIAGRYCDLAARLAGEVPRTEPARPVAA